MSQTCVSNNAVKEPLKRVVVNNKADWMGLFEDPMSVEAIEVKSKCCNEKDLKKVVLGCFVNLREWKVENECFENVEEVELDGLSQLTSVVIGLRCFTRYKNDYGYDPNRHFYLKNCERLRELKMGRYSFSDYSVCVIENVPSLEVIEIGDLNDWSCNFFYASLSLMSDADTMK